MNLFAALTGPITRMSHVNRYSSFPVNRRENVAEHSWWVGFIAYLIAGDLYKLGEDINFEILLEKAMMHDVSECISGDVIRSYKHSNPTIRDAMKDADEENVAKLFSEHAWEPLGLKLHRDWKYAKLDNMIEGRIVAFADMAAVAFYCREEDRSGNRAIREVLKDMYESWFCKFHDDRLLSPYMTQMFPNHRWPDMLREEMLPAQLMYPVPVPGHELTGAMMPSHSEGPVSAHEFEGPGAA